MPSLVCSRAVTSPETIPAASAAPRLSHGCPLTATMAPTAAPSVKHPSVLRSQTFSME